MSAKSRITSATRAARTPRGIPATAHAAAKITVCMLCGLALPSVAKLMTHQLLQHNR